MKSLAVAIGVIAVLGLIAFCVSFESSLRHARPLRARAAHSREPSPDIEAGDKPMSQAIPAVASEETFDGTWPFRARYTDAAGFRMHYIDEGSGPETLLLLHGEPCPYRKLSTHSGSRPAARIFDSTAQCALASIGAGPARGVSGATHTKELTCG